MKVLRHFERLVMIQVVVAIVAFCLADANPPLLLAATSVVLGAWLLRRQWPEMGLPRWAVNLASLASVGWLLLELGSGAPQLVTAAGRFVISLQVIVLWGPQGNREYGQLMALSLLLMIAAAVLTVQLAFGLLLAAYCLVALLAVLMLEIKSTGDRVIRVQRQAAPAYAAAPARDAVAGRNATAQLRSAALTVGLACAVVASGVFIALPRSESTMVDLDLRRLSRRPGFADRVQFGTGGLVNDDPTPVMAVRVSLGDGTKLGQAAAPVLLRGAALDDYRPNNREWVRSVTVSHLDRLMQADTGRVILGRSPERNAEMQAEVALRGIGAGFLFAPMPPTRIDGPAIESIRFNPIDYCISTEAGSAGAMVYTVRWPALGSAGYETSVSLEKVYRPPVHSRRRDALEDYAQGWTVKPRRVGALAQQVLDEQKLWPNSAVLAAGLARVLGQSDARPSLEHVEPRRRLAAARALARYLREEYSYSLDAPRTPPDDDPTTYFLFVSRQGHCEAFASALAALCRSVGLPTRVVTGYRVSEYNEMAGEFVVRRRHAHAWNEVYLGRDLGWRTLDATPPDVIESAHAPTTAWWKPIRNLYEFVEFRWIRSVVAYDRRTRDAVIAGATDRFEAAAVGQDSWLGRLWTFLREIPHNWRFDRVTYSLFGVVALTLLIAMVVFVRNLVQHRRRLKSLRLAELPRRGRRSMARRLRFYLVMVEALERHGFHRPEWQGPRTYADQLALADPERFAPVVRLTHRFYEVRFGHREVDDQLAAEIRDDLTRLEPALSNRSGKSQDLAAIPT